MNATRPEGRARSRVASGEGPARRAQVLAIAEQLFATHGYSKTMVRDIGDAAGLLSGSLYYYFPSKEAMLTEILRDFMGTMRSGVTEVAESDEPARAKLDELVRRAFATIDQRPHAVALYQKEASGLAVMPAFAFVTAISDEIETMWVDVLVAGQQVGNFRADVDARLAYRFIRDAVWASAQWYRPQGRFQHGAVADQYLALLHAGLLTVD